VVTMLPELQDLFADHNAVHGLDLSLGPNLKTLDASHNEITLLALVPGPIGRPPFMLSSLDISHAKLASLDPSILSHLSSLKHLRLSHNSFQSIPETLGDLVELETFSCSDNKLKELPASIGRLVKLEDLDAHNNNLKELPRALWNCGRLERINVTSNLLGTWHDPPALDSSSCSEDGSLMVGDGMERKASASSFGSSYSMLSGTGSHPPLTTSLKRLYLGENELTDDALHPIMQLRSLLVLNLSFNELQDLPSRFFSRLENLEELYLSGNKIA
ncbi:hypothetical protein H0H93_000253, partial [Arthromyces matolae]